MVDLIDLTGLSSDSDSSDAWDDAGLNSPPDSSHTRPQPRPQPQPQPQPKPQPSTINRPSSPSLESINYPFRRQSPTGSHSSRGPISPPPVRRPTASIPSDSGRRAPLPNRPVPSSILNTTAPSSVTAPTRASVPLTSSSQPGLARASAPARADGAAVAPARAMSSKLPPAASIAIAEAVRMLGFNVTGPFSIAATAAPTFASAHVPVPQPTLDPSPETLNTNAANVAGMSGTYPEHDDAQLVPTQRQPSSPKAHQFSVMATPKAQTLARLEWDVDMMEKALAGFRREIKDDHSQMTAYLIDSVEHQDRRCHSGADLFATVSSKPVAKDEPDALRVKYKQHGKNKEPREEHHPVLCIKSDQERVPRYRNHYVEIKKNVLTPGTMLTFVPHVRDLDSSEEAKYNDWLKGLEQYDRQSGFKPLDSNQKLIIKVQAEIAATVSLYLEKWLDDLSVPGLDKSALIRYAFREETAFTPRQRTNILKSHNEFTGLASGEGTELARMFTKAFHRVFGGDNHPPKKRIELRQVLLLDEVVDNVLEPRPKAKDGVSSDEGDSDEDEVNDEQAQKEFDMDDYLERYWNLSCAVCFSNACDHGEYNRTKKEAFPMPGEPQDILRRRKRKHHGNLLAIDTSITCRRRCHRSTPSEPSNVISDASKEAWTEEEHMVMRTLHATLDQSKVRRDPFCVMADFLDRDCCDVFQEFQRLPVSNEPIYEEPRRKAQMRNITWYDRYKKVLIGDWEKHCTTHDHTRRKVPEPCAHEGPCTQETCGCVQAGALCEKFCECTAECCVYKFTGCACHSQGKTCISKQKDRPCICVQLCRECDPDLCGSCGSFERAQPENAEDEVLHSKGCQNCSIQRGNRKSLMLGESQLQNCGYGLFTAVDIAQDDFVIEYVGELITHDEGIRREQRRGDIFSRTGGVSYLFTLLEEDAIWVDAATYGNLSRYINHASEGEVRGCNITPCVVFVNAEYRIKFTALRNIKAGEELFFNYGEHFPHLTEKLMDEGEKGQQGSKKAGRRPKDGETARKTSAPAKKKSGKSKASEASVPPELDDEDLWLSHLSQVARKRKHGLEQFEEDEYQPTETGFTGSRADSPATLDSDEPIPQSLERLRKRTRRVRPRDSPSPDKYPGQPKTRGKRGGARPGSGRPRKHPRPASRFTSRTQERSIPTSQPIPAMATVASQPDPGHIHWEGEIDHSEEDRYDGAMDGDGDEDDDDQDVVIRTRRSRTARSRRPPAKFREDEPVP